MTAVWTLSNARACSRANQSKTSEFARAVMKELTSSKCLGDDDGRDQHRAPDRGVVRQANDLLYFRTRIHRQELWVSPDGYYWHAG